MAGIFYSTLMLGISGVGSIHGFVVIE